MTKISAIGGEFELIKRVTKKVKDRQVLTGIGDDTAVIRYTKDKYLLWTADMLVENDHFSKKWSTPEQIGMKSMEVNVSDIASMGGIPRFALISICLTKDTSVEFVEKFYKGIYRAAKKYNFSILGGDTTHGKEIVIDVTMIGEVEKKLLTLRSGAKEGDLILVTGHLGKSKAGLELLRNKKKGKSILPHLEPKCQLKKAREIARYATSMEDVSDGLAAEVKHICEMSKNGAVIYKEMVPVSKSTIEDAKKVGQDAVDFALYGGEDFELVFTINKKHRKIFNKYPIVGEITKKRKLVLMENGKPAKLGCGYDHFK